MPKVPDTNIFNLQDVYNSVSGHAGATSGNLSSCFTNAVAGYFDATYNQNGYAPANSMLRFRNYTPYSIKHQTVVVFGGYIYRSIDAGATWNQTAISANWRGVSISSTGQYQTATNNGGFIYRSTDYGVSWNQVAISTSWYGVSMSADGRYQSAVTDTGYVYVSSDYGASWTVKPRLATDYTRFVSVSSTGQYQIVSMTALLKSWVSSDYGETWALKLNASGNGNGCAVSGNGQYMLSVSTGPGPIYRSTDYGQTWNIVGSASYWRSASISENGQYQIVGNINGPPVISSDYGATWQTTGYSCVAVSMSSSGQYITTVKDNGAIYISNNYGATWALAGTTAYWFDVSISD